MSHSCWIDSCEQCDMPDCSCDCHTCPDCGDPNCAERDEWTGQ